MNRALEKTQGRLLSPVGTEHSSESSEGLGFPVAAAVAATATIASTGLQVFAGGGSNKLQQRREMIRAKRGTQRLMRELKKDLASIESRAQGWSKSKAQEVLETNAKSLYQRYLVKYQRIVVNAGVSGAISVAKNAADTVRQKAIEAANTRLAWITFNENKAELAGIGAGIVGTGILLWNQFS